MPYSDDFLKLRAGLTREYLNRPVPKKLQRKYGRRYELKDIHYMSYPIAKSHGIKIDK